VSERRSVVIASTDFRPLVGGVADYLHRVAEALTTCSAVTVMTTVPQRGLRWSHAYQLRELPPLPERRLGRRIGDSIPAIRKLHTGSYFLALRSHAGRTVRQIAANGDGPVVVGIWDTASHFWCDACRRAGVDYYLVAYGLELLLPLYGDLPRWRHDDFAGAKGVIAISQATADLVRARIAPAPAPAIVNPIAGDALAGPAVDARREELRKLLGPGAGPILLSVGRLVARKGFDLVVEAVARLVPEFPNLRYVVIGDGPERERLHDRAAALGIADRVLMLGRADDAMKWAAYGLCDLFVMPNRSLGDSDWEGFGIVFVEAARAGKPAVAGRAGGVADAVVDGDTGLLVDPDAPEALVSAIRQLLADPERRARMGRNAAQFATRRFTTDQLRAQLLAGLAWN
jgi:phosphatidylinositol alpha-1,6-mannosyltransferase